MLVRFESSETGEVLMYADAAGQLLRLINKDTTALGSFLQPEMLAASLRLREAIKQLEEGNQPLAEEEEGKKVHFMDKPVSLSQRAWPLIDMLERTSRGGEKANILWEAAADF